MAILAILTSLCVPVFMGYLKKCRAVAEISGARQALTAWQNYAAENNNQILTGYESSSRLATQPPVTNTKGETVSFPINARYVFRLAPYLNNELKGALLVNKQARLTGDYEVSMAPSFGYNITFVGGDYGSGSDKIPTDLNLATYGQFVVTNMNQIYSRSKLIVFASARINGMGADEEGYNAIKSPYLTGKRWPDAYDESLPYYDVGNMHLRFTNRAVCAMADGHVDLLSYDQLLDMRRWSNQAAEADNPNWVLVPL